MNALFSMHSLEMIACVTGLLNVYLAARANIWTWFFGCIAIILYLIIFFEVKLYADMSLQLIFLCLQGYGIYQWLHGGEAGNTLPITKASLTTLGIAAAIGLLLFVSIIFLLQRYTDSTTIYMDAFTTAFSIVGQWMMSRKLLQHWWVWLMVDSLSIQMYLSKGLYFTSALYASFLIICIIGLSHWRKQMLVEQLNKFAAH